MSIFFSDFLAHCFECDLLSLILILLGVVFEMSLGQKLKLLRNELDLTQEQFSKQAGIIRATYARYETDANQPDYETLKHLAKLFKVSINYLLDDEVDILSVLDAKHPAKVTVGDKPITSEQRSKLLEVLLGNTATPNKKSVIDLSNMVIAANAERKKDMVPISKELRLIIEDVVNEIMYEKSKKS